jgi:hypothetical protein
MINECGVITGKRSGKGNRRIEEKTHPSVHHKSGITCPGTEQGLPWREI